MTKASLPLMLKGGFGRIVNMSPPIRLDVFAGHTACAQRGVAGSVALRSPASAHRAIAMRQTTSVSTA